MSSGDHYPPEETIRISHGSGPWQWWTVAANNNGQTTLILPMPDSMSNVGTWPVKFAEQFNEQGIGYWPETGENHSTGLILHYKQELSWFGLTACNAAPAHGQNFGVGDCVQPATVGNNRTDTHLENSGTLRIEMKALYNADGCDVHVRMAHRQLASLLGNFAHKYNFIELAYYVDVENTTFDSPTDHPCLTEERDSIGSNPGIPDYMKARNMGIRKRSGQGLPPTVKELEALLD